MNTRRRGSEYESRAAEFLKEKGYEILEKNYRCKFGEIDIVAREKAVLVFVEVKHRKNSDAGNPLEAVGYKKIRRISMTAAYYMMMHHISTDRPVRFDVIGYLGEEPTHIKDAFMYDGPM